jgi:hypothetical protein
VSSKCTSASATPGIARMARCNRGAISYAFALLTIRTCTDATGQADADGNGRHYDRSRWADGVQYPPCSLPGAGGSTLTEPSAEPSAVSGVCVCVRVRVCVCACVCVCVCVCVCQPWEGGLTVIQTRAPWTGQWSRSRIRWHVKCETHVTSGKLSATVRTCARDARSSGHAPQAHMRAHAPPRISSAVSAIRIGIAGHAHDRARCGDRLS